MKRIGVLVSVLLYVACGEPPDTAPLEPDPSECTADSGIPTGLLPELSCASAPELCGGPLHVVHEGSWVGPLLDVLFLPEGYTEREMPLWRSHVDALSRLLLDSEPFRTYRERFRLQRVDLASNGNDLRNATRTDTLFHGCVYPPLGLALNSRRIEFATKQHVPSAAVVVLIANSSLWRGSADFAGDTHRPVIRLSNSASLASGVLGHELGHSLFRLGDEYAGIHSGCFEPAVPAAYMTGSFATGVANLSTDSSGAQWSDLTAGAELNGNGYACGVYNPPGACRMESNTGAFCAVCQREIDSLFAAQEGRSDRRPVCDIGLSQVPSRVRGSLLIRGMFRDWNGLGSIKVRPEGTAFDVRWNGHSGGALQADGALRPNSIVRFHATLDTTKLVNGDYPLQVECTDALGSTTVTDVPLTVEN